MSDLYNPLNSLREGHWFKLICGASFQHLPAVRNLTLAYTLAGADCIDVAADPAAIAAAREALQTASHLAEAARQRGYERGGSPWLMVSLNDGEDPHFRKAEFNPTACPSDCPRPCESICPANAIVFGRNNNEDFSGVIDQKCYGCGRCVPICPIQHISTRSYVSAPSAIAPMVLATGVDAVEIHTQVGRIEDFKRLWSAIAPWVGQLKLVAISCPDGQELIDYLWSLYEAIAPLPCPLIWQTDGRPMSGDIGDGTTRAAVKLGQKVLAAGLPGYVQLAGGTNDHTVAKLKATGLLNRTVERGREEEGERGREGAGERGSGGAREQGRNSPLPHCPTAPPPPSPTAPQPPLPRSHIAGVAYGSYARVLLSPVLDQLEQMNQTDFLTASRQKTRLVRLEETPDLLWQAVARADSLVSGLKIPIK